MEYLYKILKLGCDNPQKAAKLWFAIMVVLSSLGFNVLSFMDYGKQPVEVPQVVEPLPAIQDKPKVVFMPTAHEHIDYSLVCKRLIDDHEQSDLH